MQNAAVYKLVLASCKSSLILPAIKTKILFVCLGNICRSPLAEGIFNEIIYKNNTSHLFDIDSAGTSGLHRGQLPDPRTLKNAKSNGLTLTHKARQFRSSDFMEFDYLIAMDDSNLRDILEKKPEGESNAKLIKMRSFDMEDINADVPDPWYGGDRGFEEVYQILKRSCLHFYESLLIKKT